MWYNNFEDFYFMQDEASAHFANAVHSFLNKAFLGTVTTRRGSTEWTL